MLVVVVVMMIHAVSQFVLHFALLFQQRVRFPLLYVLLQVIFSHLDAAAGRPDLIFQRLSL